VLEHGSQEGWVRVHYVGYPLSSPWAQEWVGEGKLRMTGLVQWQDVIAAGDEVEVRVQPAETLNDRMYWPATIVAVGRPAAKPPAAAGAPAVSRVEVVPEPVDADLPQAEWFLVRYPALAARSGARSADDITGSDADVRELGGHEYVLRDAIHPLRQPRSVG
jgi:hypothetical protein